MKLAIICEKCGKIALLESNQAGQQVYLNQVKGFRVDEVNVERSGDIDEIEDIDDVGVEIEHIRIRCEECDDYLSVEGIDMY